jgi:rfaE bifunctional protein kinase chain/domain
MKSGVLVFGDIMLDKYIDGAVTRISPEAPVPVVNVQNVYNVIGGCGNVSNSIASLNVLTSLLTTVGNDIHASELDLLIKASKINAILIKQNLPTTTKVRIVSNKHQLVRFDYEKIIAPSKIICKKIIEKINLSTNNIAVISDYGKGICTTENCQFLIKNFNATNRKVLVDPKSSNWAKYGGAFLISPNFKEFCEAINKNIKNKDAEIELYAKQLMQQYNIENILVTRSAKGMSLISSKNSLHIPTQAKEVYDVTGAGDTVIATIAAMLSIGKTLKSAVQLANKAAAIAIAHFGTYAVTSKELSLK